MQITDETIDYVGILAKLSLSPEEKEQAKKLATKENLEKAKDIAQDVIKKVTDKK